MKEFDTNEILGGEQDDMRDYIRQLVEELRKDDLVYEQLKPLKLTMKEVRENIAKLNDFREDFHYCYKCPGLENCNKRTPHIQMHVERDGAYIKTEYGPCTKIIEKIRHDSYYVVHDFPSEWKYTQLKDMDMTETRRPVIKEFANILHGKSNRWIFLTGNHKVGKSHLLVAMINEYIAIKNSKVAVLNAVERIKQLADLSVKNNEVFTNEIELLSEVPLLVLDGFGEEYKSEYIRDSIILPILSERERNNRLTFFASSFTIDEIQKLYSVGKTSGEIRGKQLGNILREMCDEEFDVSGTSYRK